MIRPIVSPALSVRGLTIGRAAGAGGAGVGFGAAPETRVAPEMIPAEPRNVLRVVMAED